MSIKVSHCYVHFQANTCFFFYATRVKLEVLNLTSSMLLFSDEKQSGDYV